MEIGPTSPGRPPGMPPPELLALLERIGQLRQSGDLEGAIRLLEAELAVARAAPFVIERDFPLRVQLATMLGDLYLTTGALERARELLAVEAAFAEQLIGPVQASGTPIEKRAVYGGRVMLRDRATQAALIGQPAPEIPLRAWALNPPQSPNELASPPWSGRVMLLEFWATWCRPCLDVFPKLQQLHEQHAARGLSVLALTRFYAAERGTAASETEELELIRTVVSGRGLDYPIGIMADEQPQLQYGATAFPTLILVDRRGVVRHAHFGGGDARFEAILSRLLDE